MTMDTSVPHLGKRLLIALLLPLLAVLAGCKMTMDITVAEDDTLDLSMSVVVPRDLAEDFGDTPNCDELMSDLTDGDDTFIVEDQSTDSEIRCLMRAPEPVPIAEMANDDTMAITHEGSSFHVKVIADPAMADMEASMDELKELGFAPNFEVTYTFPGQVQSVTTALPDDAYQIDGEQVVFTSWDFFGVDTEIVADDHPAAPTKEATQSTAEDSETSPAAVNDDNADSSTSVWIWIVVALVIVALVITIIVLVMKNRKQQRALPQNPQPQPGDYPPPMP